MTMGTSCPIMTCSQPTSAKSSLFSRTMRPLRLATSVSVFIASISASTLALLTLLKLKLPSAPEVRVRTSDCSVYSAS